MVIIMAKYLIIIESKNKIPYMKGQIYKHDFIDFNVLSTNGRIADLKVKGINDLDDDGFPEVGINEYKIKENFVASGVLYHILKLCILPCW